MRPGERQWVVCIRSTDTGRVREFRPGKTFRNPRWAPDGQHLFLRPIVMEGRGFYRMDVQSGEVTLALGQEADGIVTSLRVSPDHKSIRYTLAGATVDRLVLRDAKSGQERGSIAASA